MNRENTQSIDIASLNIVPIDIKIITNYSNGNAFSLTSSVLYNPKKDKKRTRSSAELSEYPFIMTEKPLPDSLKLLPYSDIVDFFFNQKKFEKYILEDSQNYFSRIYGGSSKKGGAPTTALKSSYRNLKDSMSLLKQKKEGEIETKKGIQGIIKQIEENKSEKIPKTETETETETQKLANLEKELQEEKQKLANILEEEKQIQARYDAEWKIIEKENSTDDSKSYSELENNIVRMIALLFPITYPTINNWTSSYEKFIEGKSGMLNPSFKTTSIKGVLKLASGKINENRFSYISQNGKIYTVTRCVWLNDIFNHPLYDEFVKKYNLTVQYKKFANLQLKKTKFKLEKTLFEEFNSSIGEYRFTDEDISFLKKQLKTSRGDDTLSRSQGNPQMYNRFSSSLLEYDDNIQRLIEEINESKRLIMDIEENMDKLLNLGMNIKLYYSKVVSSIGRNTSFEKKMKRFIQYTEKLHVISIVLNKFINSGNGITIYFDNEDDAVKTFLTSNYSKLVEFSSLVKTFLPPVRETTNVDLQTLIDNFSHGYFNKEELNTSTNDVNQEEQLLENVINEKKHETSLSKFRNTKVCIVEKDKKRFFEIYLHVDVVEGVITYENMNSIKCSFQSNDMTSRLRDLISNKQLSKYRIVAKPQIDINSILEKNKQSTNKTSSNTNISGQKQPTSLITKGGKYRKKQKTYKRKKYYRNHNHTIRKYKR
jgi:hypothetical protein